MCEWEKEYISLQQTAQSDMDNSAIFSDGLLNEWGIYKPTFPHVPFEMLTDDNFITTKMDDIVLGTGAQAYVNTGTDKWCEQVNISMCNHTIWTGAHLSLNMQERWKWLLTHYDIEHTLWRHPDNDFIGYGKQA